LQISRSRLPTSSAGTIGPFQSRTSEMIEVFGDSPMFGYKAESMCYTNSSKYRLTVLAYLAIVSLKKRSPSSLSLRHSPCSALLLPWGANQQSAHRMALLTLATSLYSPSSTHTEAIGSRSSKSQPTPGSDLLPDAFKFEMTMPILLNLWLNCREALRSHRWRNHYLGIGW